MKKKTLNDSGEKRRKQYKKLNIIFIISTSFIIKYYSFYCIDYFCSFNVFDLTTRTMFYTFIDFIKYNLYIQSDGAI